MDKFNAEVFVTIARLGSYSKAADELGYTKAGISYIVGSMEEVAGFKFFDREYGGVRLTPEGEAMLPFMQRQLECEQTTIEQLDRIKGLETGHIKLISFNTVIVCWLPEILNGFKEKYPGIEIELFSCDDPVKGAGMIRNREADCGFLATDHADGIDLFLLCEEPDVAVVGLEHPMAKEKVFPVSEMGNYPLIGYPKNEAPIFYEMAKAEGVRLNQIMTVDNDYGCFAMISQNVGYGVYPKLMVDHCQFPVKGIPLDNESTTPFSFGIRSYENGSLASRAFADYVMKLKA